MPETKKENKVKKENLEIESEESTKDVIKDKKSSLDKKKNSDYKSSLDKKKSTDKNSVLFYVITIITALLLVAFIIGGLLFFAIKNNVNGIADNMGDSIDNIPVLRLALPVKPNPEDEVNMTEEQVRNKYNQMKADKAELDKRLSSLTIQTEQLNKLVTAKDTNASLLQQQKDALEKEKLKLTDDIANLKKDFNNVSNTIAKGDTTEYKKYFEKIEPKLSADLYAQILKDQKMSEDVKKYCSIYETMDASAVAGIMEQMDSGKMALIVEIMKNLKKDTSGEILSEMTPEFAAKVSVQLAKVYNVGTTKETK
jgi:flagellar motility protein MotE (MotC chaperone)